MQYCEDIITGIDGSEATFVRYVLDNSEDCLLYTSDAADE